MRVRWPLLATLLSVGVAYIAYPYVTLYRLGSAIKDADAATLQSLVDWPAVREGIEEDVCDLAIDQQPTVQRADSALPPFGASFMRGIAASSIDQAVTPQALLAATGSFLGRDCLPSSSAITLYSLRRSASFECTVSVEEGERWDATGMARGSVGRRRRSVRSVR